MGSFKGSRRNQGPDRRRVAKAQRVRDLLEFEHLESRQLLAASTTQTNGPPVWQASSNDLSDIKNGPMANAGADLIGVYQKFQQFGGDGARVAAAYPKIEFQGDLIRVDIKGFGDFNNFLTSMRNVGLQVEATDPTREMVEGLLPINALPTVSTAVQTVDLHAVYKPFTNFVGQANNQAEATLRADVARPQFGVDGTGITVGVISDSISQFAGGLADSVRTGDLPSNINIIQDGPAGSTDEGRAMLENVHDIAPGASLAFATGDGGELNFADNIRKLAAAGSRVINDDLGYLTEPMFQDGIVAQAVIDVANQGVTYLSAAGNSADSGYQSPYRGVVATPGQLASGRYMNFNPGGGVTTLLPITTTNVPGGLTLQFDQPWYTTNGVTTDVDVYVVDAAGAVVASSTSNNLATQQPFEFVDLSGAAANTTYFVAINVVSGPDPGFVRLREWPQAVLTISQQFGTAGGTTYPTTFGHAVSSSAIGVGAIPWWGANPTNTPPPNPVRSEPFSSFGPVLIKFDSLGNPLPSPQTRLKPDISAPDGGNTSFFGFAIDTSNPPFPGEPATPTNLSQNLPSFFGTSSATPNAAAVAALLLQKSPGLTPSAVRAALVSSASPLNGAPPGQWDVQGGFGEIDAVRALSAIDVLRVVSTSPANGQTITQPPGTIVVTFNKPVDINTVQASDLVFTAAPANVSAMAFGTPIPLDDPRFPTMVAFPFTLNAAPGILANGVYTFFLPGPITSQDGKSLVPSAGVTFALSDTTAPRVVNATVRGRIITVQFSEAMRASTINRGNLQLIRAGGVNNNFNQPGNVNLNDDPRVRVSYDPATNTAILDYSALDQSQMPTDKYILIVKAGNNGGGANDGPGVQDLVGNFLDGEANITFPSGDGDVTGRRADERFLLRLGVQTLVAPIVTSVQLTPGSDTGLPGDANTRTNQPILVGQVAANFPGTISGLTVLAQFNGLHGGGFTLGVGGGGRGFVGGFDVQTTTDANGTFTIQAPVLPEGYDTVRIVVIGKADAPPLPGLSSQFDSPFRIDRTGPSVIAASLTPGSTSLPLTGTNLSSLSTLSLDVLDRSNPTTGPLSTPQQILITALDPATAGNLSNYQLINLDTGVDFSSFIANAVFVPTAPDFLSAPFRASNADPMAGRIDLKFNEGLPAGRYALIAHTSETIGGRTFTGLRDAAANPLDNTGATGAASFRVEFTLQSQATFITNMQAVNVYNGPGSVVVGGPRSFYELPALNQVARANAPPSAFIFDFSNPLDPTANYTNAIRLVASADSVGGGPDGDFGTLGIGGQGTTGSGFSVVPGTTVQLADKTTGALQGQAGFNKGDRLVLTIQAGTTLRADKYRLYIPNAGPNAIFDIFGNQLDGEFVGAPTATGGYDSLLPNGQYRPGLSGDGVAGGAFTTGFVVVPNGNVVYARPDYVEDPLNAATIPDGSLAKPYSALAPEANPSLAPNNPLNDPNGGLNASSNFFSPNVIAGFDRNGNGRFDRSALYAAQQLATRGPVVVVALPGIPTRDPLTGVVTQKTFVLQAPAGSDPRLNDASASVPFDTMLVFNPGSALKLQNASLYVQNQGSALQVLGGINPSDQVNFTSVNDSTVGGNTTGSPSTVAPRPGDWGGIIFRNFDNASNNRNLQFPIDATLQGFNGSHAISGADDALSIINFAKINYAGGSVPQTRGIPSDAVMLFNSRPTVSNTIIAQTGAGTTGAVNTHAAISGDLDSFREDDLARGPLIRRVTALQNSLNGILIRPDSTGAAEGSDAIIYPDNPPSLGGGRNYAFDDPLPYLLTSQVYIGQRLLQNTGGQTAFVNARLYIQPGMLIKSQRGAGIAVVNNDASINIGSRSYINSFDADNNYSPSSPNFKAPSAGDARVLFTSLYDNAASTAFFDPTTQQSTVIVPPIDSANSGGANQPTPGNVPALARWGSVSIQSGAQAVINAASFRYGGGLINGPAETFPTQSVLAFITSATPLRTPLNTGQVPTNPNAPNLEELGTHAFITNNNFFDNLDTAMQIEPNGLLAGDPMRPLLSGHPFFRNNVMQRNDIDGMAVVTSRVFRLVNGTAIERPVEGRLLAGNANLTVNSVWDSTDLTYVLRGSIVLSGAYSFRGFGGFFGTQDQLPNSSGFTAERTPFQTLTLQSALPGTVLADGTTIARPGESLLVKMMSDQTPLNAGVVDPSGAVFGSIGVDGAGVSASTHVGAGFVVGVDDGVDPPANFGVLPDPGVSSQIRFVGIGGNETTGQARVPVILTSLRDGSVGKQVRGVNMFNIYNRDILNPNRNLTVPQPGDGGYIYYGGMSLTDYNLYDPRDGNLIDNADIRYMTRIEIQGGGIIDFDANSVPQPGSGQFVSQFEFNKLGQTPLTQFNSQWAMTISNSNLSSFADAGVFIHATSANALIRDVTSVASPFPGQIFFPARDQNGNRTQGATVFLYGNTITNMPIGIEAHSDQPAPQKSNSPENVILLNNTFDRNGTALHTMGYGPNNNAPDNHVYWFAMNNIFANSTDFAINTEGVINGSQAQYNVFWNNGVNVSAPGPGFLGNVAPIFGDPKFRDPANGNYQLGPDSVAIDASRSEIGPLPAGDALYPTVDQIIDASGNPTQISVRTNPATLTPPATPGRSNTRGGLANINDPRKLAELPGQPFNSRGFFDEWIPALPGSPGAVTGPASNAATFAFAPLDGVRDANGFLRDDFAGVANVGTGSNPFYDIGAFEFRQFFPPKVTGVTATVVGPAGINSFNIYRVGGIGGTNQTPQTLQFQLDHGLDPSTVTNRSVLLQASGGDGIFGNGNSAADRFIDLSGKLFFDPATSVLTVHLADTGLTLSDDRYRVTLKGNGSDILRDRQGNALDGENTANDDPNNPQLALPSGDGFPGGDFFLTFTINATPANVVPGTFNLATTSDTNKPDNVTFLNKPTFSGTITSPTPAINPVGGQIVVIDISTTGNGVFDRPNAGTAVTNAQGGFAVSVGVDAASTGLVTNTSPLPDTPYNVGPDGLLNTADDIGRAVARVRIIDASGNTSSPTDPNARTTFIVDTDGPTITGFTPAANSLIRPDASGRIQFTFTTNKNVDPTSLNANSILVQSAGPDGVFNTADDVAVPIDANSITVTPLKNGPLGPEQVSFTISGALANSSYAMILKGTGANSIIDVAGNPLFGTGGAGGRDFSQSFVVFNPGAARTIFAAPAGVIVNPGAPQGSRANPFPTITEAIAAAVQGDVVAVLPGVYTERITLKSLVRVISVDVSSTDSSLVQGNALQTIIRAPSISTSPQNTTVTAAGLTSIPGLDTELAGFTIASPLLFDPALGPLDPNSIALRITNSNILVDRNYFVDAGFGIAVETAGGNAEVPRIINNGVIGNIQGILVNDTGTTSLPSGRMVQILNNTIAFNTLGVFASVTGDSPVMAILVNNIFWQNNDKSSARNGFGILSTALNKLIVRNNMFQGNGSDGTTGSAHAGAGVGNGFSTRLGTTPDALGNFLGQPAFVSPRDPRTGPGTDGPASFFIDANFSLTSASAAIDAANPQAAPATDFLGSGRVRIPGRGFAGLGPADIGAFEFQGTAGTAVGGAFRIVTTSLSPGGATVARGATMTSAPGSIIVDFSGRVNRSSVTPNDLVLSGTAINSLSPVRATSLTWIDDHTVRFNLSGSFKSSGTINIQIPPGAVRSTTNTGNLNFADFVRLGSTPQRIRTAAVHAAAISPTLPPTVNTVTATSAGAAAATATPPPAAPPTRGHAAKPPRSKLKALLSLRRKGG